MPASAARMTGAFKLGIVQGLSGAPLRVCCGWGPERSSPKRRRTRPRPNGAASPSSPWRIDSVRSAASSTGSSCSAPLARSLASITPLARPRRPATMRSGQPSSSASVSFSPGSGVAVVVEDLDSELCAQLFVEAVRRLALGLAGLGERDEVDPPGARSRSARRCRARRRPARSPRRRFAPGRPRSCPSRSGARCPPRRERSRPAAPSSGCRA